MEIVYILTNPVMPGLVKIGRTTDINKRVRDLSKDTGVPIPFECFYACEVKDGKLVEEALHDGFKDVRINPKREFFEKDPERILSILKAFSVNNVTPKKDIVEDEIEREALRKQNERRSNFKFSIVGIEAGAILTYTKDENLTAEVVNDRQIRFEDKVTSISNATRIIEQRNGSQIHSFAGPMYWLYNGKTLSELRNEIENS